MIVIITSSRLLLDRQVHAHNEPVWRRTELISVSVKVDVTAKLVEVALIPDIQRKSGEQLDVQSGLITPGHLLELGLVALQIGELALGIDKDMPDRSTLETNAPNLETYQNGHVEILVFFFSHQLFEIDILCLEIGPVGVEQQFRLNEYLVSNSDISTELGAHPQLVNPEVEKRVER